MELKTVEKFTMYIPRVALSSSSSSNKSFSKNRQLNNHNNKNDWSEGSESEGIYANSMDDWNNSRRNRKEIYFVHKAPKLGSSQTTASSSASSLSSSNRSNYSVNSLLLSVENLENFNRSNAVNKLNKLQPNAFVFDTNNDDRKQQMMENIKNILAIEDLGLTTNVVNGDKKVKDPDELSNASSMTTTNFTVVTFNDSHRKAIKSKSFCRRSHQVTILILVMTFIFVIGISALVCMLEMRFQNMPR